MRILGPIVLAQAALVASRQADFGLCRAVRAQPVGNQHIRHEALFLEQLAHQFPGRTPREHTRPSVRHQCRSVYNRGSSRRGRWGSRSANHNHNPPTRSVAKPSRSSPGQSRQHAPGRGRSTAGGGMACAHQRSDGRSPAAVLVRPHPQRVRQSVSSLRLNAGEAGSPEPHDAIGCKAGLVGSLQAWGPATAVKPRESPRGSDRPRANRRRAARTLDLGW